MKDHFPFTDYDFYAYLTSGAFLLALLDMIFNGSSIIGHKDWNFAQITIGVATAYVVGHIVAMLAQSALETALIGRAFAKPMDIQLGLRSPNKFEKLIGFLVGRYYDPLPAKNRERIIVRAAEILGCEQSEITSGESVFQLAFKHSFSDEKVRHRIDGFRNQYGFCRNMSFVALIAAVLFTWSALCAGHPENYTYSLLSAVVFLAMFIRYLKFLSTFQAEVIRSIN
jgi:hypothetical protein